MYIYIYSSSSSILVLCYFYQPEEWCGPCACWWCSGGARPWDAGAGLCAQPMHWWSSMAQSLPPQETETLTQSSIPISGAVLGTLAHSSMPTHCAPEGFEDACPQQCSFSAWKSHQKDLESLYTEALPSLPDKAARRLCKASLLTTLQWQVSGSLTHSSDPTSMRPVMTENLGTGLCR